MVAALVSVGIKAVGKVQSGMQNRICGISETKQFNWKYDDNGWEPIMGMMNHVVTSSA